MKKKGVDLRFDTVVQKIRSLGPPRSVRAPHLVGPEAADIIQGIAIAIRTGATKPQFDATLGIRPTVAEELVSLRPPES